MRKLSETMTPAEIAERKRLQQQEATRRYNAKHPDRLKASKKKYRASEKGQATEKKYQQEHRPQLNANSARWRSRNKPECAAKTKKHQQENPDMWAGYARKRNALKKKQLHPEHNKEIERFLDQRARTLTKLTGCKHCIDHIIPLEQGGWHHHDNLQVMFMDLNSSKRDNPFWEHSEYMCWRDVPQHLWPEKLVPEYTKRMLKHAA